MSYYVYVLQSQRNSKRYVGMTSRPPVKRLAEHNRGSNAWTKHNGPFELVHSEEFQDKAAAAAREKFLKSGTGRRIRDKLVGD